MHSDSAEPRARRTGLAALLISNLGGLLLAGLLMGLLALWMVFYHYSQDLPSFAKLSSYDPPVVTRLYAADGKLLAEYATQRRNYVPLAGIPKRVQQAFLSAEDKNFYTHPGVDFSGIGRALITNALHAAGGNYSPVGGSTITQQVVKNFLLTNEKTLSRKIKEAILAFRITQSFSKSRILELYLNEIYLGSGSYGVAAAALNYFNKSVDELTVEEAAMLAALPKAPRSYDPRTSPEQALGRRNWVIERMADDGVITRAEAEAARATPIALRRRAPEEVARADFFAEEVRRQLAQKYGANVLYEGGLYVKTTLDPVLQNYADAGLRKALTLYDRRHGWRGPVRRMTDLVNWQAALANLPRHGVHLIPGQSLAVVRKISEKTAEIGVEDGSTGIIPLEEMKWARRALGPLSLGPVITSAAQVVSPGDVVIVSAAADEAKDPKAKDDKKAKAKEPAKTNRYALQQEPQVNGGMVVMDAHTGRVLAMSGGYAYGDTEFNRATQAKRQPGSSFKPFVYLAALEAGLKPNTIILDGPIELSQGAGLPAWRPQNYTDDFLGPVPMRQGLEQSRNAMTVRLATMIGVGRPLEVATRFGIYTDPPRQYSVMLGSQETTLIKLTTAYAMLANGGMRVNASLIERIDDRHGKPLFRRDARNCALCQIPANPIGPLPELPTPPDDAERVADAGTVYQLTHMLEGVVERGTAVKAKVLGRPLAGKTGTTNDSRDTWFMGFTPDLVVGTYVGFDRPTSLGKKETGGAVALPAFIAFMQDAMKDVPPKPFPVPENIRFVAVDRHTGQPIPGMPIINPYAPDAPSAATPTAATEAEPGVDEAPADSPTEIAADTAPPAPAAAPVAVSAPVTPPPLKLVGAPPSPSSGIIMEAFRVDALPNVGAPAPAAISDPNAPLPWLQNGGAAAPMGGTLGHTAPSAPLTPEELQPQADTHGWGTENAPTTNQGWSAPQVIRATPETPARIQPAPAYQPSPQGAGGSY